MESLVGHVAPGLGFLLIALWHLFNQTKLHTLNPKSYTSTPWFPSSTFRYLELTLMAAFSSVFISTELLIGPEPRVGRDWSILPNHLRNFEHSSIALTVLAYSLFAIVLDRSRSLDPAAKLGLTWLAGAAVFAQELLLFHLHSNDHMGVVGQYHWLVQLLVAASLAGTLLGAWRPGSFLASFARSASVASQGVWFIVMGFGMWVPAFVPQGCAMRAEEGTYMVRCEGEGSLERAKSMVNIVFSWFLVGMVVFCVGFYLVVGGWYCEKFNGELDGRKKKKKKKREVDGCDEGDSFIDRSKGVRSFELEL